MTATIVLVAFLIACLAGVLAACWAVTSIALDQNRRWREKDEERKVAEALRDGTLRIHKGLTHTHQEIP